MNELANTGANVALVGAALLALAAVGIGILLMVFRSRREPHYDEVSDTTDRPIITTAIPVQSDAASTDDAAEDGPTGEDGGTPDTSGDDSPHA